MNVDFASLTGTCTRLASTNAPNVSHYSTALKYVRNVSILEETSSTRTLRTSPPSDNPHLQFTLWVVKYELVSDGFEQHTRTLNFRKYTASTT